MIEPKPLYQIHKSWRNRVILKVTLWILLAIGLVFGLSLIIGYEYWIPFLGVVFGAAMTLKEWRRMPENMDIIRLVNQQFQPTEYSTELVFESTTNDLRALQQQKVLKALSQSLPSFVYPVYWKDLLIAFLGVGFFLATSYFMINKSVVIEDKGRNTSSIASAIDDASDSTYISKYSVQIRPPKYSGLARRTSEDLDINTVEHSKIIWNFEFSKKPSSVWLELSSGDSLVFEQINDSYQLVLTPSGSNFYSINYIDGKNKSIKSDYYKIELLPDMPPEIEITGIPSFQRLRYERGLEIKMNINMSDNYQLTDGFIVATISKGSGESVKFREQKIPLPGRIKGKETNTRLTLELDDFEMEPGNELYFYGTAFDNHWPERQQSRTETFFYILEDTAQVEFSLQGSLGIDLMPEFFRSQLQIILDTEKLVKERNQLSDYDFNFESNALGFDQKQLRLKYGQFLGEEAEDAGLEVDEEEVQHAAEHEEEGPGSFGQNILSEYGHDHDHENEEGQLLDKGTEANPLDEFMHVHEEEGEATFYTQSLKSKLRSALNEMWDSELYLRLYKPEESLQYQYRAQALLQEIRNHARIYVKRIGFEPPPVNEAESRLTGELKELNRKPFIESIDQPKAYPAIRNAIVLLDNLRESAEWTLEEKQLLEAAGAELAQLAIDYPGAYLNTLNELRGLIDQEQLSVETLIVASQLKRELINALPIETISPSTRKRTEDELTQQFIENLISIEN